MTDLVPVQVHELEEPVGYVERAPATDPPVPEREDDLVRWIRAALLNVDDRRAELAAAGEWEALAFGLVALKEIVDDLRAVTRAIEDDVVRLLPSKRVELEGLGVLERKKGSIRRNWQSLDLLDELLRVAVVDRETGEVLDDELLIRQRIHEVLTDAVPFTGSLGWRVSALRDLGLDPDEWCETTPARTGLQITDNRKDDE